MPGDILVPVGHEWLPVSQVLREIRANAPAGATGVRFQLPGTTDPAVWDRWRAIRDSRFYLVRNRGGTTGERYPCKRCSTFHVERGLRVMDPIFHEFFTYACVSRPWRGLVDALWSYTCNTNNENLAEKVIAWAPQAGIAHPFTFGRQAPPDPEADVIAIAIGVLEPITETKARQLAAMINSRRPAQRFVL